MAGRPLVAVKGARQLRRTLRAAGDDLADLKAAHARVGEIAVRHIAPRVPVLTGRTLSTLRVGATKTAAVVRIGRSSMPWVGRVHYGDPGSVPARVVRLTKRLRHPLQGHRITPHPYLTDGAKEAEPEWTRVYLAAVEKSLDKIKGV